MTNSPTTLIQRVLRASKLNFPSGKPLYTYTVSTNNLKLIEVSLKDYAQDKSTDNTWASLFVLYASVWWRTEYNGSNWSWEPILKNIDCLDLKNRSKLYRAIETGFSYWKRPLRSSESGESTRYIGSIFAESGLPNCAYSENHFMAQIIEKSYLYLVQTIAFEGNLRQEIQRIANKKLPATLAGDEAVLSIIQTTVVNLFQLARKHPLAEEKQPILYLDQNDSEWRNRFPISMDIDAGTNFIDSLLSNVAKEKIPTISHFSIQHQFNSEREELSTTL